MANELHDGLEGSQRFAAPVLSDVAEEAVLNLVALAGAGREVRDADTQLEFVAELLHLRGTDTSPPLSALRLVSPYSCTSNAVATLGHHA